MLGRSNKESDRFPDERIASPAPKAPKEEPKMVNDFTNPKDMNTFIAKGSEFAGKLTFEGTVRIDGKVDGEIFSKGTLIIGPGADIKAKVNVDTVIISGNLDGNITAKKKTELRAPAKLKGNIMTPSLVIEEGVIFEGNCKMEPKRFSQAESPQTEALLVDRPEPKSARDTKIEQE